MTITTYELECWISDDRNHSVNINSGVLSDMCCEIIRDRVKIETAENLAEAARVAKNQARNNKVIAAINGLTDALVAWEAAQ